MSDDWEAQKQELIAAREESLFFFSNENKLEREKYVVRDLLEACNVSFSENELLDADEPADVQFENCRFQVKEIMNKGRRRYDELKESLERAKNASSWDDLLEPYTPRDLEVTEIVRLTCERAKELETRKYGPRELANLDLLCYCNFNDVCEIESNCGLLETSLFRSISVVSNRYRMVIYASENAPQFLKNNVGSLKEKADAAGV